MINSDRYNIEMIQKQLQEDLDDYRYEHTVGVAYTAASLAMCYGYSVETAFVAGLLHDCAKCMDKDEREEYCKENHIQLTVYEFENPSLQHAKIGSYLCETKYHVNDENIKNAIASHTTGRPDMSLLEKIIFIADYIEPNRMVLPRIDLIRKMAFTNINYAVKLILNDTINHLKKSGKTMDPMTEETYKFYKNNDF